MGELTNQVINHWAQIKAPPVPSLFEPDIKSSYLKTAIKSEILTPSHTVSIAPISFKVEVDPLVYLDQLTTIPIWAQRLSTMGLLQSVEIKATGKLAFKGDKEVAFKSKSNVEYSSNDDDEAKTKSKFFVGFAIVSSVLVAIAGEVLASKKLKTEHKYLWLTHMGLSRILFMIFSLVQKEKIKIELATTVKAAADQKKTEDDAAALLAKNAADQAAANAQAAAILAAVNPISAVAAAAAATADTAAAAAAAAQATADQNNDALTQNIAKLSDAVQGNAVKIDQRLQQNSKLVSKLQEMVEQHQTEITELRDNARKAATGESGEKGSE
jgi:hypothetical protein